MLTLEAESIITIKAARIKWIGVTEETGSK